MKIKLFTLGKTKEKWLDEAMEEYVRRLPCSFEMKIFKSREKLLEASEKRMILLDPQGKLLTSEDFSLFLMKELELGGAEVTFVIGDAYGLPEGLKGEKMSLSPLTFTHQIARLILVEQIYRAFEIARGSPYHK